MILKNTVNFNFKADESKSNQYGLIAEEVEEINPDFVFYNESGTIEGVHYDRFTPVLIKAVQDQKQEINELKVLVCLDHPEAEICQ